MGEATVVLADTPGRLQLPDEPIADLDPGVRVCLIHRPFGCRAVCGATTPVMNLRISVSLFRMTANSYAGAHNGRRTSQTAAHVAGLAACLLHVEGSDPCDRRRAHHHSDCPQPPARLSVGPKLPAFNNASTSRPSLYRGPYRSPSAQSVPGRRRQAPDDTPDTLPGPALKGVVQRQSEFGDPPPTAGPAQAELVDPSRDHLDALAGVPRLHRIGPHLSGTRRPSS